MSIESIVLRMLAAVRGKRSVPLDSRLKLSDVLVHILQKGFCSAIRGTFKRMTIGSTRGLLFYGKNISLLSPNMLRCGNSVFLGSNSYIDCFSTHGVTLGSRVTIREGAWLQLTSSYGNPGESITIADDVYIGPGAILGAAAPICIGQRTQIGARVSLVAENHQFDAGAPIFDQGVSRRGIRIGSDCWLGNNVTVLDGVDIGEGCVIGAGAVVTSSIPANCVAVGVPARVIRHRVVN